MDLSLSWWFLDLPKTYDGQILVTMKEIDSQNTSFISCWELASWHLVNQAFVPIIGDYEGDWRHKFDNGIWLSGLIHQERSPASWMAIRGAGLLEVELPLSQWLALLECRLHLVVDKLEIRAVLIKSDLVMRVHQGWSPDVWLVL